MTNGNVSPLQKLLARVRELPPAAGLAAAIILVALAAYFLVANGEPETDPETDAASADPPAAPPPPEPEPPPEAEEEPDAGAPGLDDSDSLVRDLLRGLSEHPGLASWLVTDELIRTFVVVVDNVADMRNPAQHLPFLRPGTRFATEGDPSALRIAAASHARYDGVAEVASSLDPEGVAEIYRRLRPLMEEAYAELGQPGDAFHSTLRRAAAHLLDAPIIEGQPQMLARGPLYLYADETLESLSTAERQFMSMGPDNQRRVQQAIRDIARAIGFDDLPSGRVVR